MPGPSVEAEKAERPSRRGLVSDVAEQELEPCPECAKLRKKLQDAEERERLLSQGMDHLILELRRRGGKKLRSKR